MSLRLPPPLPTGRRLTEKRNSIADFSSSSSEASAEETSDSVILSARSAKSAPLNSVSVEPEKEEKPSSPPAVPPLPARKPALPPKKPRTSEACTPERQEAQTPARLRSPSTSGSGDRRRSGIPKSDTESSLESPPTSPKSRMGLRRRSAAVPASREPKPEKKQNRASILFQKLTGSRDEVVIEEQTLSGPTGFAHRAHGEAGLTSLTDTTDRSECQMLLRAVALWSFDGAFEGELKLDEGEEIFVEEQQDDEEPAWWYGCSADGKWGYFPSAWVRLLHEE